MFKLKGDKAGYAGRYVHKETGFQWTVSKWYFGRGLGAGWQVEGPYFSEHRAYDRLNIQKVIANWLNEGVEKVA